MKDNKKNEERSNSVLFAELDKESTFSNPNQLRLSAYKRHLILKTIICFFTCIILVLERIFHHRIVHLERDLLDKIQSNLSYSFSLQNPKFHGLYAFVGGVGNLKFFSLLMTHFLISVYVSVDAIVGLKGLFVHCLSLYTLTLLELVYQGPQPFWVSENIQTFYCEDSFTNPSFLTFGFFFDGTYLLMLYLKKKREIKLLEHLDTDETSEEDYNKITYFLKILVIVGIILAHIILFLRYLIGLLFISDYVMGLIYFAICYFLVKFFDFQIDKTIKRSTVLKKKARRYSFFWIVFLIFAVLIAYVIYLIEENIMPVKWIRNYVKL